jgi:hypothetical protein
MTIAKVTDNFMLNRPASSLRMRIPTVFSKIFERGARELATSERPAYFCAALVACEGMVDWTESVCPRRRRKYGRNMQAV